MHDYDPNSGIIFYSQVAINGVSCYNTKKQFSTDNHAIIQRDDNTMIYPSDLNVNMRSFPILYLGLIYISVRIVLQVDSEGTLWVMSNSMPVFIYSMLDTNDYNFRVWKVNARDAVHGTVCQPAY